MLKQESKEYKLHEIFDDVASELAVNNNIDDVTVPYSSGIIRLVGEMYKDVLFDARDRKGEHEPRILIGDPDIPIGLI